MPRPSRRRPRQRRRPTDGSPLMPTGRRMGSTTGASRRAASSSSRRIRLTDAPAISSEVAYSPTQTRWTASCRAPRDAPRPAGRGCTAPPSASRPRPLTSTATRRPAGIGQVGEDRVDQLVGDLVGRLERRRAGRRARRGCPCRSPSRQSGSSNVGLAGRGNGARRQRHAHRPQRPPAARGRDRDDLVERRPAGRGRAGDLVEEEDPGDAASPVGPVRRGRRDVVGRQHASGPRCPRRVRQLRGEVEVQHVAAVVAVQVEDAAARRDRLGSPRASARRWARRRRRRSRAPSSEARADVAHEHRQVAGAAAGDDGDLACEPAPRPGRSPAARSAGAGSGEPRGCPRASRRRTAPGR